MPHSSSFSFQAPLSESYISALHYQAPLLHCEASPTCLPTTQRGGQLPLNLLYFRVVNLSSSWTVSHVVCFGGCSILGTLSDYVALRLDAKYGAHLHIY